MAILNSTGTIRENFYFEKSDLVNPVFRVLKALTIIGLFALYFLITLPIYPVLKLFPVATRKYIIAPFLMSFCKTLLKVLGYKITTTGNFNIKDGTVIISNHLSYMDMLILWSVVRGCFISTVEVQQMPLFGKMAALAGSVFIERRSLKNLPAEVRKVEEHVAKGINMVFFPEGMCTDGTEFLKFKKPFFKAATRNNADILTMVMNVHTVSGKSITKKNVDKVLWYRQKKIILHIWDLLSLKSVEANIDGVLLTADEYLSKPRVHVAEQAYDLMEKRIKYIK